MADNLRNMYQGSGGSIQGQQEVATSRVIKNALGYIDNTSAYSGNAATALQQMNTAATNLKYTGLKDISSMRDLVDSISTNYQAEYAKDTGSGQSDTYANFDAFNTIQKGLNSQLTNIERGTKMARIAAMSQIHDIEDSALKYIDPKAMARSLMKEIYDFHTLDAAKKVAGVYGGKNAGDFFHAGLWPHSYVPYDAPDYFKLNQAELEKTELFKNLQARGFTGADIGAMVKDVNRYLIQDLIHKKYPGKIGHFKDESDVNTDY